MKKRFQRLLSSLMVVSFICSLLLPSAAAAAEEDSTKPKVVISSTFSRETVSPGEEISIKATITTDNAPKSPKYSYDCDSDHPKIISVEPPKNTEVIPTITLKVADTFDTDTEVNITLYVTDTNNNNVSATKVFKLKAIAPPPVTTLTITPSSTEGKPLSVRAGSYLNLEAVAKDKDGNEVKNATITWDSGTKGVATVSQKGSVHGERVGTTTITAKCNGVTSSPVTVQVVDAFSVDFVNPPAGNKITLKPTVKYDDKLKVNVRPAVPGVDNLSTEPVEWKSTNTDVAIVTPDEEGGKEASVQAGATPGTAYITATVTDPVTGQTQEARCQVVVEARNLYLRDIQINENQDAIKPLVAGSKNNELKLSASLIYQEKTDGTDKYTGTDKLVDGTSDTVEWTSSDPKIATVWQDGTVRAVAGGKVTITATSKDTSTSKGTIATGFPKEGTYATASREITINQDSKRITLSNTTRTLEIKETLDADGKTTISYGSFELQASHDPESSYPRMSFDWKITSSSNPGQKIITWEPAKDDKGKEIEGKMKITAVDVGEVTLTVTGTYKGDESKDPETASCTIIVTRPVTGIILDQTTATLKKGESAQLTATLLPEGKVKGTIRWSTSNNQFVRVDETGKITAAEYTDKPVKITASIGDRPNPVYTATCEVTVARTGVDKVTLVGLKEEGDEPNKKKTASVSLGSYLQLSAEVAPKTATNTDLIWSSSDENYATVNRNGKVTPQRKTDPGKPVIITVKSKQNEEALDTVELTITAHKVTGVRMQPADPVTLDKVGDTVEFVGSLVPSTADDTLRWTVSGGSVNAGVVSNSVLSLKYKSSSSDKVVIVTGLTPGESDILVNVGDFTVNNKVTVSGVTFEKTSLSVAVGKSEPVVKKLFGTARNLNANDWEWSSDNDMVARVNPSTGMVSGIKPGTAKITCKNGIYSAEIPVTVSESSATVLSYKMTDEKLYNFATKILSDIRDQCKTAYEGSDLNYVTNLSVPPSQGTLYYGYVSETNPGQGVAASDKFYYKTSATSAARPEDAVRYATGKPLDKLLADVTFVPATGFSGKADISYTAVAENGKDLAGSIQITVPVATELTYNSPNGEAIRFHTNDFSTLSQATSGYPISSVRFNAPSERYGYLYYEYAGGDVYGSNITSGQRFYASSTPSLDSVTFVPRAGYTGTFPITFTGWNTNGASFTGTIRITVKTTGEGGGDISYSTLSGSRVYFDASDFQALCRTATGGKLNYVQFTALPSTDDSTSSSSSSAVLYHGSRSGSRVSTSSSLYATSSGSRWTLDNVYLLPSSSFIGSVTIPFKGWDTDRKTFEGTVVVNVTKDGGTAATIYMTCTGMPLVFSRADFDDACKDALPALLKSVRFHLPGSNSGTLYLRFNDLNDRQPLAANQDILAADLVTLSYLPKGESSGTVYLSYTATDEKDNICTGQVRITIDPNTVSQYFIDLDNTIWAIPSVNFLRTYGVVTGKGKKRYQPNDTLKRGDFVLMLARAFDFSLSGTESFPDVPRDSYYAGAIAAGKSLNLIKGSGKNGSFRPEDNITRQEAATILFRVLQNERNLTAADTGYLTAYSDMGQIEPYAQTALATLVRDGIFEGSGGRLYPYAPLTRAQMAVILHRAIT